MADEITESFLQEIAGDIEKLLVEDQETIAWAFKKITAGFKINIGVVLDQSGDAIALNYSLSFDLEPKQEPIEKHKVTLKRVIDQAQASMEFIGKEIKEGRMSVSAGNKTIGAVK